jgi:hypothetical protein
MYSADCVGPVLMKLEFSKEIFGKFSNIKFNENHYGGSRVVPCGRADRRTDMTKLIAAFRNFANAPKMDITKIKLAARRRNCLYWER